MAFTYLILNILFIAAICMLFLRSLRRPDTTWWITLVVLMALTLIFDNIAIATEMFRYNPDRILGLHLGLAPIEDFFYALFAVIIIPTLWRHFQHVGQKEKKLHDRNN